MTAATRAAGGAAGRARGTRRRSAADAVRFPCARCGRPVFRTLDENPRKIRCTRCRYLIYDYPRPCSGVVVMRGDDVLMLRRAHAPKIGWLDIPGGFMDAGETIEGAARRELREETGLTLGPLRSLGMYWDEYELAGFGRFPTMNFYFVGQWRHGEPRAADDAASAEWIPLARLGGARQKLAWRHMREVFRDVCRVTRGGAGGAW